MASYFSIELDTTPPIMSIEVPINASPSTASYFYISANEALGSVKCWLMNGEGVTQEIATAPVDDKFVAEFTFTNLNMGRCQLITEASDIVGNTVKLITRFFINNRKLQRIDFTQASLDIVIQQTSLLKLNEFKGEVKISSIP